MARRYEITLTLVEGRRPKTSPEEVGADPTISEQTPNAGCEIRRAEEVEEAEERNGQR